MNNTKRTSELFSGLFETKTLPTVPNPDVRGLTESDLYQRQEEFQAIQDDLERRSDEASIIQEGVGHLRFNTAIGTLGERAIDFFRFDPDLTFDPKVALKAQGEGGSPPEQWEVDITDSAVSEEHLMALQEKIADRKAWRDNSQALGPIKSAVTDIAFEALNPVNYVPYLGAGVKMNRARTAILTGLSAAAMTSAEVATVRNTYSDISLGEVVTAGMFAGTLGAGVGSLISKSPLDRALGSVSKDLEDVGEDVLQYSLKNRIKVPEGSVGAAKLDPYEMLTGKMHAQFRGDVSDPKVMEAFNAMVDDQIPQLKKGIRPDELVGAGTALQRSDNPMTRYIGSMVLENSEGTGGKVTNQMNAGLLSDVYFTELSGKYVDAYMKNYNKFNKAIKGTDLRSNDFGDLVYKDINAIQLILDETPYKDLSDVQKIIRDQANEVIRSTKRVQNLAARKGVTELQNLDKTSIHLARQYDSKSFVKLANIHGKDEVTNLIAKSILEGDEFENAFGKYIKKLEDAAKKEAEDFAKAEAKAAEAIDKRLTGTFKGKKPGKPKKVVPPKVIEPPDIKALADNMAKAIFNRMSNRSIHTGGDANLLSSGNQKLLLQALDDTGLSTIEKNHIKGILDTAGKDRFADPTKKQISMNMSSTHNGLRMTDLLSTDLAGGYLGEMRYWTGRAALAEKGFNDRGVYDKALDSMTEIGKSRAGADVKALEQTQNDFIKLDKAWNLVTGIPIESDVNSTLHKTMRGLRKVAALSKLGKLGFAQASETARTISSVGIMQSIEGIPVLKNLKRDALSGKIKDTFLRDLEDAGMGRIGDEYLLRHKDFRVDDIHTEKFKGENTIDDMNYILGHASGFNTVSKMQKRFYARQYAMRLYRDITQGKLSEAVRNDIGWTASDLKSIRTAMEKQAEIIPGFGSNKVANLRVSTWPSETREAFIAALHRQSSRAILKQLPGESPIWASTAMGQFFTQFRSFALVSTGKHGVHDIKMLMSKETEGINTFLFTAAFASALYTAKTTIDSYGLSPKKRKKYLKNRLSTKGYLSGAGSWMGQFGFGFEATELLLNGIAPQVLGDDVSYARTGEFSDALGSVPGIGFLNDAIKGSTSLVKAATSDYDLTKSDLRAFLSTIPFNNAVGFTNLKNAALGQLE